jgi:hypothetical protein
MNILASGKSDIAESENVDKIEKKVKPVLMPADMTYWKIELPI